MKITDEKSPKPKAEPEMDSWYANDITQTIGNTPLVKLNVLPAVHGVKATILAKLEFFNPSGSVKDRMAVFALRQAVVRGELRPGSTIVEATSGNTGAAVAMYAAANGHGAILTIPDKMSQEKIDGLRAFGAEVHVCPTAVPPDDPQSYTETAKRLQQETPDSYLLGQFTNSDNIRAHYESTGPEIWTQTGGRLDVLVGGIGTGGTISGTAKYIKEQKPSVKVIAADPVGSIYYDKFATDTDVEGGSYLVEGIGDDILCPTLDFSVIDQVCQVADKDSFLTARDITRKEGIFVGGSSGAAMHVALTQARSLDADKIVIVILPDGGARYVSKIYNDTWMLENGFI